MLVPVNGMKNKYFAAARRQFLDRPAEQDAVDGAGEIRITFSIVAAQRWRIGRYRLVCRKHGWKLSPTKPHTHCIHRDAIQPCRKSRISTKTTDGTEHLQENFLRKVFRLSHVFRHHQA